MLRLGFCMLVFLVTSWTSLSTSATVSISGTLRFRESGTIYISLCSPEEFKNWQHACYFLAIEADPRSYPAKELPFQFPQVPPGRYAIRCFQDTNGNGKLDFGLFGPREPTAFFQRSPVSRRAPRFEEISFEAMTSVAGLELRLK